MGRHGGLENGQFARLPLQQSAIAPYFLNNLEQFYLEIVGLKNTIAEKTCKGYLLGEAGEWPWESPSQLLFTYQFPHQQSGKTPILSEGSKFVILFFFLRHGKGNVVEEAVPPTIMLFSYLKDRKKLHHRKRPTS